MSWVSTNCVFGQVYKVEGYRSIFERRFSEAGHENWFSDLEANMTDLIRVVAKKSNKYQIIVPLQLVTQQGDTSIAFYYAKSLRKIKNTPIKWTSLSGDARLKEHPILVIPKKEIAGMSIDFDSVARVMRNNIVINSEKFNFDVYLATNVDTICYRATTFPDLCQMVYLFFTNGVILSEDPHTSSLYYLSY